MTRKPEYPQFMQTPDEPISPADLDRAARQSQQKELDRLIRHANSESRMQFLESLKRQLHKNGALSAAQWEAARNGSDQFTGSYFVCDEHEWDFYYASGIIFPDD